jgi:hypothetical protein
MGLLRIKYRYWPVLKHWLQRSAAGGWITRRLARR